MKIILKLKKKIDGYLDFKKFSKLNDEKLNYDNIYNTKLLYKNKLVGIKDLFLVRIYEKNIDSRVFILDGSSYYFNFLGFRWKNDKIKVLGDAGSYLGLEMESGEIELEGSCENFLGSEMTGGLIRVKKDVGDFLGAPTFGGKLGMNGGVIVVGGNAGNYLGKLMRRGIIIVCGDVKNFCCLNMIAGTVIIKKNIGSFFGSFMKRGTLILFSKPQFNNLKFIISKGEKESFFGLLDIYLKNFIGVKVFNKKKFKRYIGDRNNNGLAEILIASKK